MSMIVEIVKAIRWFLFIMLLSGMAHWNSFFLLLKQRCQDSESPDGECTHDHFSMLRTMFNTIMWLLFMTGDVLSLEDTDHHGVVVAMFLVSMVAVPLILINMLIAIMGDSYLHMRVRCFICRFFINLASICYILVFADCLSVAVYGRICHAESQHSFGCSNSTNACVTANILTFLCRRLSCS